MSIQIFNGGLEGGILNIIPDSELSPEDLARKNYLNSLPRNTWIDLDESGKAITKKQAEQNLREELSAYTILTPPLMNRQLQQTAERLRALRASITDTTPDDVKHEILEEIDRLEILADKCRAEAEDQLIESDLDHSIDPPADYYEPDL